ncbi:hypothetical protein A2U01_0077299, partial [Trifolium medium]|nr:hypothetical protein [Trifolium medium]
GNSFPTVFSNVVDHKDGAENILGNGGIHPLQNNCVETVPEVWIIGLCLFSFLLFCRISGTDDMIKYVMDTRLNLKQSRPREIET